MGHELVHRGVSEAIIGAAMTVLNILKPGLDEKLYERALVIELQKRGHRIDQQTEFPVHYDSRRFLTGGIEETSQRRRETFDANRLIVFLTVPAMLAYALQDPFGQGQGVAAVLSRDARTTLGLDAIDEVLQLAR